MAKLEAIQADLERSQLRLAEIRANLKPIDPISEISKYMEDFEKIKGWFHRNYVPVYFCINSYQEKHGIRGNLAEIGVYHGKSFIPLCCLCNPGELALAVDIFGDETSPKKNIIGDFNIFSDNIQKYLPTRLDCIKILQVNSEKCTPQDYLNKVKGKKMRIFSVDGCHTSEATAIDLRNAYNCLVKGGVIILDDYFQIRTPGVSEGFHRFLLKDNPDLKAFFIGWNKMLLTHSSHAEGYLSALRESLSPVRQSEFLGSPVLIIPTPKINWIS
ncbi:MAG: class I SAM-dependent methyltransferase [Oscillatoriaceae cyanobacterium]